MSSSQLKRMMGGADAMFLYFERKEMPLHIGCVAILDGPSDDESEQVLAARLHEIPRYRQRLVFSPFNLTHPSWEDDPEFDIHNHIARVRLPQPGNERQLSELSGRIFTNLMDRNRPLWDLTIVDGLEGGLSALIIRVHHSLVDGVSGVSLVNVMFDHTPEPRSVAPESYRPLPLPDPNQVLVEGLSSIWTEGASRLIGAQISLLRLVDAFTGDAKDASRRSLLSLLPELLRPTMKLPFNGPCSGVRGHCWTSFPFGEAKGIRAALGGTINDVVLTAVSGAVSRYVAAHREPLRDRFVRLLVPVSLRPEDQCGRAGNEISMLPLPLPLDIEDPAERMRTVSARSSAMKSAHIADVISLIGTGLGWLPPVMQQSLAATPFLPQPVLMFNLVCTNVPGPMVPLYSNGRELLTYYPHVPCGADVGIGVAVSSYNRSLYCGVTYDCQAAPDGELFRDFLVEAYEELREAAGVAAESRVAARPRESPVVDETPRDTTVGAEAIPAGAEAVGAAVDPPWERPVEPAPAAAATTAETIAKHAGAPAGERGKSRHRGKKAKPAVAS